MRRAAILASLALAAAACGGGGSKAVAQVGPTTITRADLERTIEHFREEAEKEGKPFPDEGDPGYAQTERRLIGLLAYRAQLKLAADKLGVTVDDDQVEARMKGAPTEEGEQEGAEFFARNSVRAALLYEGIYAKLTAGVPAARREAFMRRWIEKLRRRYPPRILIGE